jgi:hypothetical protein
MGFFSPNVVFANCGMYLQIDTSMTIHIVKGEQKSLSFKIK